MKLTTIRPNRRFTLPLALLCLAWAGLGQASRNPIEGRLPGGWAASGTAEEQVLSAGYAHTCALKTDGTLACWGNNSHGKATAPTGTFTAVSAGAHHTCALRTDGTLACWGANDFGQLNSLPTGSFTALSAGGYHSCAIKADGTLACWGSNDDGQTDAPSGTFTTLSAGNYHNCALHTEGTVMCWGDNSSGQAPQPSLDPASLPNGLVGNAYSQVLSMAADNYTPLSPAFSLNGTLPAGLSFLTDTLSGTPTGGGSFPITAKAVDANGFAASQTYTLQVNVDTTPPVITPVVSGTLGNNGWYTSNVSVTWTVTDPESSVSSQLNCNPTVINTDTGGTTLTCQANSSGGTANQTVTVKRDATAPTLAPVVSPNPVFLNGTASATPHASDAGSGVAASSCGTPDTNQVGGRSDTCTATDLAGNSASAAAQYTVSSQPGGFSVSATNLSQLNRVKAGDRVPFNWRVTDANGQPVTSLSGVTLTVEPLTCPAGAGQRVKQAKGKPGGLGFQNLGNGNYRFNWKTLKAYGNSCQSVKLNFNGGTGQALLAQFRFSRN